MYEENIGKKIIHEKRNFATISVPLLSSYFLLLPGQTWPKKVVKLASLIPARKVASVQRILSNSLMLHFPNLSISDYLNICSHTWKPPTKGICKLQPTGQIWPTTCFCTARESRKVLIFFYGWRIKRTVYFCDTWKWYKIQISVSKNKILLKHSQILSFTYGLWSFLHRNRRAK